MAIATLPHHHTENRNAQSLQRQLSRMDDFCTIADVFGQLGDPNRIRIFWLLCHCEECVINIAAMLDMSSPAVSHHLRTLRNTGLIVSHRDGKEVFYRASDTETSKLLHHVIEQVMKIACPEK